MDLRSILNTNIDRAVRPNAGAPRPNTDAHPSPAGSSSSSHRPPSVSNSAPVRYGPHQHSQLSQSSQPSQPGSYAPSSHHSQSQYSHHSHQTQQSQQSQLPIPHHPSGHVSHLSSPSSSASRRCSFPSLLSDPPSGPTNRAASTSVPSLQPSGSQHQHQLPLPQQHQPGQHSSYSPARSNYTRVSNRSDSPPCFDQIAESRVGHPYRSPSPPRHHPSSHYNPDRQHDYQPDPQPEHHNHHHQTHRPHPSQSPSRQLSQPQSFVYHRPSSQAPSQSPLLDNARPDSRHYSRPPSHHISSRPQTASPSPTARAPSPVPQPGEPHYHAHPDHELDYLAEMHAAKRAYSPTSSPRAHTPDVSSKRARQSTSRQPSVVRHEYSPPPPPPPPPAGALPPKASSPNGYAHPSLAKPETDVYDEADDTDEDEIPPWARRVDWDRLGRAPVHHKSPSPVRARPSVEPQPVGPAALEEPFYPLAISGVRPLPGIHRLLGDTLFGAVVLAPSFDDMDLPWCCEIEAKLGTLISRSPEDGSSGRMYLPISSEAVVDLTPEMSFNSSISEQHHRQLNDFLNERLARSRNTPAHPIAYTRSVTLDSFYPLPKDALQYFPPRLQELIQDKCKNPRARVTKDQKTGAIVEVILKVRLCDVHIHYPKQPYDVRISVNMEIQCEADLGRMIASIIEQRGPEYERTKNRLSYEYGDVRVDLTVVGFPSRPSGFEHELEIELNPEELQRQGILLRDGQPNRYDEIIEGFLANIAFVTAGGP